MERAARGGAPHTQPQKKLPSPRSPSQQSAWSTPRWGGSVTKRSEPCCRQSGSSKAHVKRDGSRADKCAVHTPYPEVCTAHLRATLQLHPAEHSRPPTRRRTPSPPPQPLVFVEEASPPPAPVVFIEDGAAAAEREAAAVAAAVAAARDEAAAELRVKVREAVAAAQAAADAEAKADRKAARDAASERRRGRRRTRRRSSGSAPPSPPRRRRRRRATSAQPRR